MHSWRLGVTVALLACGVGWAACRRSLHFEFCSTPSLSLHPPTSIQTALTSRGDSISFVNFTFICKILHLAVLKVCLHRVLKPQLINNWPTIRQRERGRVVCHFHISHFTLCGSQRMEPPCIRLAIALSSCKVFFLLVSQWLSQSSMMDVAKWCTWWRVLLIMRLAAMLECPWRSLWRWFQLCVMVLVMLSGSCEI